MKVIPREVKSRVNSNSRYIRELRNSLVSLSFLQEKILIGTLLGDACIIPNIHGKNYRLQVEHGNRQMGYTEWKYRIFQDWTLSGPRFESRHNSWKFRTISHPEFTRWRKIFYMDNKKIIPVNIVKLLNSPISLSTWFMDDGGKLGNRGLILNVQQFSKKEVKLLQKALSLNFNLSSTIHWNNSGYRIYFGSHSRDRFNKIIRSLVHPSLRYKLLTP